MIENLVHMVCCDTRYPNVTDTLNHKCDTNSETAEEVKEFEAVADMEWDVKQAKLNVIWATDPMNNRGMNDKMVMDLKAARKAKFETLQAKLFGMLEAMGTEKMKRYGEWRSKR